MGTKSINTLIDALKHTLLNPWTYNAFYNQDVWILMSPEHAQRFSISGMNPDDIKYLLFEECIFEKSDLENEIFVTLLFFEFMILLLTFLKMPVDFTLLIDLSNNILL